MIVITGGSKGIGRAVAERCAQAGKNVLAIARGQAALSEMEAAWEQFPQSKLLTVVADLSTLAGVEKTYQIISDAAITVSALINNLGSFQPGDLLNEERDLLPHLLDVNLLSAHRLTRALLPAMLERGEGHLITVGSVAASDFPEQMAAYTVSKYALHGWHYALAKELGDRPIKLTLIMPGATLTAAWDGYDYNPKSILAPEQVAESVWHALNAPAGSRIESLTLRPPTQ